VTCFSLLPRCWKRRFSCSEAKGRSITKCSGCLRRCTFRIDLHVDWLNLWYRLRWFYGKLTVALEIMYRARWIERAGFGPSSGNNAQRGYTNGCGLGNGYDYDTLPAYDSTVYEYGICLLGTVLEISSHWWLASSTKTRPFCW
jgi:hypothetical protein